MYRFKNSILSLTTATLCIAVMVILLINPERYVPSAMEGLKVFSMNVLPVLLPFFFFTKILTSTGVAETLSKGLGGFVTKLYRSPEIGSYVLVMSMLSGYPIGARLIYDLTKQGYLRECDALNVSSYTSTVGSMFTVGTVGTVMLGDKALGYVLIASHYLATLLNGLLYRGKGSQDEHLPIIVDVGNVLSDASYNAIISVLTVGVYVTVSYVAVDILEALGIIGLLSTTLSPILGDCLGEGVIVSLVEMTRGSKLLSRCDGFLRVPLIASLLTFGGVSVTLQSLTYLKPLGVKASRYLLTKLTQSLLALGTCSCIYAFYILF